MKNYSRKPPYWEDEEQDNIIFANSMVSPLREPVVVLNAGMEVLACSSAFYRTFGLERENSLGKVIYDLEEDHWKQDILYNLLEEVLPGEEEVNGIRVELNSSKAGKKNFLLNAGKIAYNGQILILLSFTADEKDPTNNEIFPPQFINILAQSPALICILKGPDHVFKVANEKYLQLIGKRDILNKTVRQVLPETERQGFLDLLDEVYTTGKPFIGKELPFELNLGPAGKKNSYLNFVYQPTYNALDQIDGIFVHAVDVTEQVLSRKKIEHSENELRELINTVPAMIWMTQKDGKSIFLNKNWYRYTGQKETEAQGFGWLDALHPDDREKAKEIFLTANSRQEPYSTSYRIKNHNGQYRWTINNGSPQYNIDGEYEGMVGTVVDVHEEKIKEQLIREKEHRIRAIVEEANVATAVYTGKEMNIELANEAMIKLWGKDSGVIGKTLREALPELEGQPFHQLLDDVYTTGKTYWGKEDKVDLVIDEKLQTGYFNFTYKPLRNENGQIYGILNMAIDVTEMVESRNLLRESEAYFRQMTDLIPEKLSTTDPDGNFIYFNKHWLNYTGLTSNELMEGGWINAIHPEERENFKQSWQRSLDSGDGFEMELRFKGKNGKYKWHLRRAEAVRDEGGKIKLWIGTNTEINRIKEEEKRKENFLKMVSHELKTPVTSIKGYVQLLLSLMERKQEENSVPVPLKPSLERIDHQIIRLTRLISEMLDLSRIEEDKLELQKTVFNINELVAETVQDIHYTNTRHKIEIINDYCCNIYADKDRIGQVLINFITNAIKYSPETREIRVHIQQAGGDKVAVSVRDRGIGIDEANHKNIFKRFYRIGVESEETYSGFGIGLYLAKEIIQRHKGSIKVESKIGEGSNFTFILAETSNT